MRTIFLALIVLNLVYFGWNYYHPPESSLKIPPVMSRDVEILTLVSESKEEHDEEYDSEWRQPADDVEADESASEEMLMVDETERCYSLGPFKQLSDAESVMSNIKARGLSVSRQSKTKQIEKSHWVYLPPFVNHEAAVRTARELAKQGIEDYFVIASGENENAISLGLYSKAESAARRLNHIRSLGYEPVQETRYSEDTEYWLDYREVGDIGLPTEFWELLANAKDRFQRLNTNCLSSNNVISKTMQ